MPMRINPAIKTPRAGSCCHSPEYVSAPQPNSAATKCTDNIKHNRTRILKEILCGIDLSLDTHVICNRDFHNMKQSLCLLLVLLAITSAYRHNGTCARCLWNYVYECSVHGNKNWTIMETQYPGGPPPSSPAVDGTYGFPGEVLYGRAEAYPGDDGNPKFFLSYDIVDYCGTHKGQATVEVRLASTGLLQTIESYATVPMDVPGPWGSYTGLRNGSGYPNLWRYIQHPYWWPGKRIFGPLPKDGAALYSRDLLPSSVLINKVGEGLTLPVGTNGLYLNMTHNDVLGARSSGVRDGAKSQRPWHTDNGEGYRYFVNSSTFDGESGPSNGQTALIPPVEYPVIFDENGELSLATVWAEIGISDTFATSGLATFSYPLEDAAYGEPKPNRSNTLRLQQRIIGRNGTINYLIGYSCVARLDVSGLAPDTVQARVYRLDQNPASNQRLDHINEVQQRPSRIRNGYPVSAEPFLSVYNALGSSMIVPKTDTGFGKRQFRGEYPWLIDDETRYFHAFSTKLQFTGDGDAWSPAQPRYCLLGMQGWKLPGAFARETDEINDYKKYRPYSRFRVDESFAFAKTLYCNVNRDAGGQDDKAATTVSAYSVVTSNDNVEYFLNSAFFNYTVPGYDYGVPNQCCDGHRDTVLTGNKIYCGYYSHIACSCGEGWGGFLCNDPIPDWRTFDPKTATECPPWDICVGRGKCVKLTEYNSSVPAGTPGVGCVCRPGWVGGGAWTDPETLVDNVYSAGVKPWVDLYVQQLQSVMCDGKRARYEFDEEHSDWAVKYPELHQCMLWSPVDDSDFVDFQQDAQCQTTDKTVVCSRWTTTEGGNMPSFPYDCANRSKQENVGQTGTFYNGPVWGGFWCNLCPACVWNNTESCGDVYPNQSHLAPNRDHPLAAVKCNCRSQFTGDRCQYPLCPGDPQDPENAALDRSACGASSGRGTCIPSAPWPEYCAGTLVNSNPTAYPSYPPYGIDGAPVFNFIQNLSNADFEFVEGPSNVTTFGGRCDCAEGWGGSVVGACSVELCPHDENGLACGHHGTCVISNCTHETEAKRIEAMRNFPGYTSWATEAECDRDTHFAGYFRQLVQTGRITGPAPCRAEPDCSMDACLDAGPVLAVWPPVTGALIPTSFSNDFDPVDNFVPPCREVSPGEWVPYLWYSNWTKDTLRSFCDTGTCVCDPGWEADDRGVCSLRSCNKDEDGLECHNVTRTGSSENVCRADPVSPRCECWRALASPRDGKFDVDDGRHFYGTTCNLTYTDQCVDPSTGVTCNGPAVSDGCYVDGCKDDWSDCELTTNRSLLVPRCHCKVTAGAYGKFCNASVCGGFSSAKPCTANNEGVIVTGQCNIVTKKCDCFDSAHVNDVNPGSPAGVMYIGDNCETAVSECGGPDNYGDHPCSGRGNCTVGVGCTCPPAYNGSRCQTELPCGGCDPDGGVCFDGQCYCHRNYRGALCNINACEETGGNSTSADTCLCPEGSTQYPDVHDVGYQAVLPAGQAYDTLAKALLLNPTGLESSFRGCRKLCPLSPVMGSTVECGGYYPSVADTGNCPKDVYSPTADSDISFLTRCKQRIRANETGTPNCTCSDEAPNPHVQECNPILETTEYHAWAELPLESGSVTCRPQCLYCFERASGVCEPTQCVGTEGWKNHRQCQYTGNRCDTKPCIGHNHQTYDPDLQRCTCQPAWLYDNSGICTENRTKCAETGGILPENWDASDVSDTCNCTHPYRVDLNRSSPTFGACTSVCGPDGTPEAGACTCVPGGIVSGTFCNESQCQHLGEPDIARRADGTSAYSDRCTCPLPQWQGTYCNTSACVHGTPKPDTQQGCNCFLGYQGTLCDATNCGPRGTAVRVGGNGTCQCDPGWTGAFCDQNLCRIDLGENDTHKAPVPERCSTDPESPLPDCFLPGFDYNCKCGDGHHARFVNVSGMGCCVGVAELDCGDHGVWGTYAHNNTYGCQCQYGFTGHHCESHVCGEDGYDERHRLVRRFNATDGSYYVECECHEPNFIAFNGSCVANCSYHTVVHEETSVHVINDPLIPTKCICTDPGYVVDVWPATWFNLSYNETSGFHCRRNCSASGTAYIDENETCVCLNAFTGPGCFVPVDLVFASSFEFEQAPVWHWGALAGGILVFAFLVFLYQYGYMPTNCYLSAQEQEQRRLGLGGQDVVSGQENTGLMSKRR